MPTVGEYWAWAFSDLRQNDLRGVLAEFLVAEALGIKPPVRSTWDDFDLTTSDGVRIEVKSAAYLQAWPQKRLSRIVFGGLKGRAWTAEAQNQFAPERTYRADLFVFCVQTATAHDEYDPLDIDQWEFRVLRRTTLEALGTRSMTLSRLKSLCPVSVSYHDLAEAVRSASGRQHS